MRLRLLGGLARPESVHDYVGVLVPLEQAHLHSHSARSGKTEYEEGSENGSEDGSGDDAAARPRSSNSGGRANHAKDRRGGGGGGGAGVVVDDDDDDADDADLDLEEGTGMLQMSAAEYTIDGLRREVRSGGEPGKRWSEYELKSKLINKAVQDIGMGRYNWQLFVLCGFGWFADNLWMQGVSLTLPSLSQEFGVSEKQVRYTTSSLFVGLSVGSALWGMGADVMGRRVAFNVTLLITAVFGVWAALASSWPAVCALFALMGTGVGGNLPVDGALFLEFLPDASSALLTLLSVWWPVGQLASSLFAWYFIARWPVEEGWRLFVATIGAVTFAMWIVRFALFHLFESPKFLLAQGRQAEAVAVVHGIAHRNRKKTWLTDEILDAVCGRGDTTAGTERNHTHTRAPTMAAGSVLRRNLKAFSVDHVRPLFQTRKLGLATALIWFCWATIGMGYPLFNAFLPQYLSHGSGGGGGSSSSSTEVAASSPADAAPAATYRNYAIISMVGVPGSLLAAYAVDHESPLLGRRGTLAASTLVSALFLFLFAALGEPQLLFTCVEAFCQNIMYGVLYAFTPELFPAPARGAGTGVASTLNRVAGLAAPVVAALAPGDGVAAPIYLSAVLILAAFGAMVCIPIETRGRQRL
ncbi:membrane transporter [Xylariaceae sp. FL0804]|nr:membrane transporter [Xylariaceae sp. FL0804]